MGIIIERSRKIVVNETGLIVTQKDVQQTIALGELFAPFPGLINVNKLEARGKKGGRIRIEENTPTTMFKISKSDRVTRKGINPLVAELTPGQRIEMVAHNSAGDTFITKIIYQE